MYFLIIIRYVDDYKKKQKQLFYLTKCLHFSLQFSFFINPLYSLTKIYIHDNMILIIILIYLIDNGSKYIR